MTALVHPQKTVEWLAPSSAGCFTPRYASAQGPSRHVIGQMEVVRVTRRHQGGLVNSEWKTRVKIPPCCGTTRTRRLRKKPRVGEEISGPDSGEDRIGDRFGRCCDLRTRRRRKGQGPGGTASRAAYIRCAIDVDHSRSSPGIQSAQPRILSFKLKLKAEKPNGRRQMGMRNPDIGSR